MSFLHITNLISKKFDDEIIISSFEEIDKYIINEDLCYVLLNIHLNWDFNKLTNFYGFNILRYLRIEKRLQIPIIFYSPLPKEYFNQKATENVRYKSILGRGVGYLEMPFTFHALEKEAKKINPLTDASLQDMLGMLFNLRGIISDKLTHDIKFASPSENIITTFDSCKKLLNNNQEVLVELEYWEKKIHASKITKNEQSFKMYKKQLVEYCLSSLPGDENNIKIAEREKHEILLLEDNDIDRKLAENYLRRDFIVTSTNNAEEAIKILNNDNNNYILAIVSDWRLYCYNSEFWQNLQGYEVLEIAAKLQFINLFALTSLADFNVNDIRNKLNVKINLFKKENLKSEGQWNLFKDIIHESCIEIKDVIASQPDGALWTKNLIDDEKKSYNNKTVAKIKIIPLKQQYIEARNRSWKNFEQNISEQADELWEYYKINSKNDHQYVQAINQKPEFTKFPHELPHKPSLIPVLLMRRIWLGLWHFYKKGGNYKKEDLSIISSMIYRTLYAPQIRFPGDVPEQRPKRLANSLCIKIQTIGSKMLPEEKNWLKKHALI